METWNSFKNKRTQVELYTEDASIMYVPTAVGVKGNAQIRRFFLNPQFSEKVNSVKETVHHTLHTGNKLIEESNWIITFHTGECTWMVPGVESSYLVSWCDFALINCCVYVYTLR
jgi:hypothetical protein